MRCLFTGSAGPHGIPYVENTRNGKYTTNCPDCGGGY